MPDPPTPAAKYGHETAKDIINAPNALLDEPIESVGAEKSLG